MEYGKLAYIKAEEIERRLAALGKTGKVKCSHISASFNAIGGTISVASVNGSGSVGIVAKITAVDSQGENVFLMIDDMVVGEATINSSGEALIICSADIIGKSSINFKCGENVKIVQTEILLYGDADVLSNSVSVDIAASNDLAAVVATNNGKIKFGLVTKETLIKGYDPAKGTTLGFGSCADIAADSDNFVAVWAEGFTVSIAEISFLGKTGKVVSFKCPKRVVDVSIMCDKNFYLVAYIYDGKIAYRKIDKDSKSISYEERTSVKADSVKLTGTDNPFIVYTYDRRCFLQQFEEETVMTVKAEFSCVLDIVK